MWSIRRGKFFLRLLAMIVRFVAKLIVWKIAWGIMNWFAAFIFLLSRNGPSSHHQKQPQSPAIYRQQQQQQYYHQQISKSKRSKSMDDFSAQMVFEQSSHVHRNNVLNNGCYQQHQQSPTHMGKRSPSNAVVKVNGAVPPQPQHKNQMRYSVDNLLEIDTSYYNNYQVRKILQPAIWRWWWAEQKNLFFSWWIFYAIA